MYRLIPVALGVLLLSGCAASAPAPQGANGVSISNDPDRMTSSDHWEVQPPLDGDNITVAAIMSKTKDEMMQLACYGDDKSVAIMLVTRKQLAGAPSDRQLAIAFDDQAPMVMPWPAQDLGKLGNSDFSIDDRDAGFRPAVDALRHHQRFQSVISESGKETLRQAFWLTGADAAIGYVMKACGKE
jgi:hypothetical protein